MGTRVVSVLLFVVVTFCCDSAISNEERYEFTSEVGQRILVVRDQASREYSVTIEDVTSVRSSCDEKTYRVCLVTESMSVVVPMRPAAEESGWAVGESRFWVEGTIGDLRWFGRRFDDVYVIGGRRDFATGVRVFRLLFSYSEGLLAYQEIVPTGVSPLFVASSLPSLGHANVGE